MKERVTNESKFRLVIVVVCLFHLFVCLFVPFVCLYVLLLYLLHMLDELSFCCFQLQSGTAIPILSDCWDTVTWAE